MKKIYFLFAALFILTIHLCAQNFVSTKSKRECFALADSSQIASIYLDDKDDWLVNKAAFLLQHDIELVTHKQPVIVTNLDSVSKNTIIIGTIGGSSIVKKLIAENRIDVRKIKGQWEAFQLQTIDRPFKGIDHALVIAGNDKRGTAYGVFELSRQIGVSPWYWWADVPSKKKSAIFIRNGIYTYRSPSVKYRGLFINDEAPAFSGWAKEKFGGINHLVYERIFELLLRLKANYLWPAMWGNAFNDDDTLDPVLANKWGIVMGTSHHEPMLRAQQEWKRYGNGPWDYTTNDSALRAFWKKGISNMDHHESIVTIGMRGDGDLPMTQGTAIDLLEKIIADQRKIIEEVTGKPASQTPQLWALYKEVQDYYDKGMPVPEDVTLLLCDDNWGNIRKLPKLTDKKRTGGYGIYYHFDYVGGPRNYKWINTNNIARVWEQMHLAYEYGVDKIWIVNVGDLKPMEMPVSFFLDYAYDTKKWNEDNLRDFYTQWAGEQFGDAHAKEIGEILRNYSHYASIRKPELLDEKTYNLDEFEAITGIWENMVSESEKINGLLPAEYKDAFFELVLHPVKAFCNLYQMYLNVALNHLNAKDKVLSANDYAASVKELYLKDSLITMQYHQIAQGKWNHMMDQTHIGYTYWQQPPVNKLPTLFYVTKGIRSDTTDVDRHNSKSVKTPISKNSKGYVFTEEGATVSIEASHWTKAVTSPGIKWKVIPDIGKDGNGVTTFPVTSSSQLTASSPHLEYRFYCESKDSLKLLIYFSPTLNFHNLPDGLEFAVSVDNEKPQIISLNKEDNSPVWNNWVANNIIIKTTAHFISRPGYHTVNYWMISPAIVLQKLVVDFGGLKSSYLGPPETIIKNMKK